MSRCRLLFSNSFPILFLCVFESCGYQGFGSQDTRSLSHLKSIEQDSGLYSFFRFKNLHKVFLKLERCYMRFYNFHIPHER
jgi:hypothetical protein